jgi:hypothetical protein
MVKTFVIDGVGIFLAESTYEDDYIILKKPLMAIPNQGGNFGLGLHPLFEKTIKVLRNKVTVESDLKESMQDSYNKFWLEKETGIITPPTGIIR